MPGRSGSADKVCPTSSPSPAAKLTGTARGNCTAKLLAANAASLASKSARCSDTDCREALTNNMPATSTFSAIRLNMMILRAKGERLSAKKPRRARRSRISRPRLVSGETKSSPNTTSPSRAGGATPVSARSTSAMVILRCSGSRCHTTFRWPRNRYQRCAVFCATV